jgi:hypothetical protein
VKNASGVTYYYANLFEAPTGLNPGDGLAAGQSIGHMGDSAYAAREGEFSNRAVHLQLKVKAETALVDGDFWFNHYPVLRLIEYKTAVPSQLGAREQSSLLDSEGKI